MSAPKQYCQMCYAKTDMTKKMQLVFMGKYSKQDVKTHSKFLLCVNCFPEVKKNIIDSGIKSSKEIDRLIVSML